MSNFIQVPALLAFVAISKFWFSGFSRLTIYKLITAITAFLIAFSIKINNKKLDQVTFEPLMNFKQSHYGSWKYSKAASFQKFSSLKLKRRTITFLWQCFLIFLLRKTLTNDFWGLHTNINCAFPLSKYFTCGLILFWNIFEHPLRVYVIIDNKTAYQS